jgi:glycosyl transferase family 25
VSGSEAAEKRDSPRDPRVEASGRWRLGAFIINMDGATERWAFVERGFAATGIPFSRVVGVDGRSLRYPIPEYDEASYRRRHGKRTDAGQVGCYLSHLKALRAFIESDLDFAVIAEDDASPRPDLRATLDAAIRHRDAWDLLRLCGFHDSHPIPFATLDDPAQSRLCISLTRLCGTGAYLVGRRGAARLLERLLPMRLPIDHAIDREWVLGVSAAVVRPLPVDQVAHGFTSQTAARNLKLPAIRRYWTVFPYRAANETARVCFRLLRWVRLATARRRFRQSALPHALER